MSCKEIGLAEFLLMRRSALQARHDQVESLEDLAKAEAGFALMGTERPAHGGGS